MKRIEDQRFGVEIELTGITRKNASNIIAKHFGTMNNHDGGSYDKWTATDRFGRKWQCMSDGSIHCTRKVAGCQVATASSEYSCEVVTPILRYQDMDDLQEVIRKLRKAGAVANTSTGIHVHVDADDATPESLTRLMTFAIGRQDLFYEALEIGSRANRWCQKMDRRLMAAMQNTEIETMDEMKRIYYSSVNGGYSDGISTYHYCTARYRGINLHSFFTGKGIEFRLFNGTTHAGKIKSYVQFCLAMYTWSVNCESDPKKLYFKKITHLTGEQKAKLMRNMMKNRLGMKGAEFKTARTLLSETFPTGVQATVA